MPFSVSVLSSAILFSFCSYLLIVSVYMTILIDWHHCFLFLFGMSILKMEKQKETVCSPDTALEDYLRNLESETDSSKASTSDLGAPKDPKPSSRWAEFLQLFKTKSKRHLSTFHPLKLSKRFSSSLREEIILVPDPMLDTSLNYFKPQWKNFALSDLQTATKSFSQGQHKYLCSSQNFLTNFSN